MNRFTKYVAGASTALALASCGPEAKEPVEAAPVAPTTTTTVEVVDVGEKVQCTELGRAVDDLGTIGRPAFTFGGADSEGNMQAMGNVRPDVMGIVADRLMASVLVVSPANDAFAEAGIDREEAIINTVDELGTAVALYDIADRASKVLDEPKGTTEYWEAFNEPYSIADGYLDVARESAAAALEAHCDGLNYGETE